MFEAKVLSVFIANRKDYDMASPHIDHKEWSPLGAALLELVESYYDKDPEAERIDIDLFRKSIARRFKDVPRHLDKANDLLTMVLSTDSSAINITSELLAYERAKIGTSLADALMSQDDIRIEGLLAKYSELMDASTLEDHVTEEYVGLTLDELEAKFESDGRWQLWPMRLGRMLKGGLRPGHSIVVAARPERGKTLFGITFTAGFLAQGAKVLYIGNEDPIPDLIMRLLACITGLTEDQMLAHKEEAMKRAVERGYNNCVFAGLSPGTLYEIEALVRRHEPDILVVDQMRNVSAKTENNTMRLEYVARELRNIARRHNCVVVAVTQVGDSGRDKLVLNDGDIDGSNTGIPGACDVIIMVGSNDEYERMNLRMVKLAKNKLGGDHSELVVAVDRDLSRVETHQ